MVYTRDKDVGRVEGNGPLTCLKRTTHTSACVGALRRDTTVGVDGQQQKKGYHNGYPFCIQEYVWIRLSTYVGLQNAPHEDELVIVLRNRRRTGVLLSAF